MISSEMEWMMRDRETYSRAVIPLGRWIILRVDGRGFTKYTQAAGYDKPFDTKFSHHMVRCAKRLLVELDGVYATTHSDEISVVVKPRSELFNRRAEKLASLAAGIVSAEFGQPFDGRVSVANYLSEVVDYFSWRQADAKSNALSSLAYWTLRKKGKSAPQATSELHGATGADRRLLLLSYGIDADQMDLWMQRGLDLSWRREAKPGFNPISQEHVVAMRSLVEVRAGVPAGDEYRQWLERHLKTETEPVAVELTEETA